LREKKKKRKRKMAERMLLRVARWRNTTPNLRQTITKTKAQAAQVTERMLVLLSFFFFLFFFTFEQF